MQQAEPRTLDDLARGGELSDSGSAMNDYESHRALTVGEWTTLTGVQRTWR
jgi:hypothetical protein